jgi:hypothetical protein
MTQDKARKAAVRARMAETGESYTEAARHHTGPVSAQAVLDAASRKFGIPDSVLSLVMRHMRETSEYPLLAASAADRLKVYLALTDKTGSHWPRPGSADPNSRTTGPPTTRCAPPRPPAR